MVAAHELDSEQPLTRAQELAKAPPATTVLKIDQKNPLNMKDRLAPGQPLLKAIKFETLAKDAEFVTGIAYDSARAPKEGDDMSSTASWGFFPRGGFSGGFVRGPYGGSAGFIRGPVPGAPHAGACGTKTAYSRNSTSAPRRRSTVWRPKRFT